MTLYLLDTDTVSHALRSRVLDARLSEMDTSEWSISAVTRAELRYGLARRPDAHRLAQLVEGFLGVARCAPWDAAAADAHGSVRAALALTRQPLGAFDEMIAAHALSLGAVLVTGNARHFGRVADLRMVDWIDRGRA